MMTYRPKGKRSLGRPLKRWRETITGHWGLIHIRKKKKNRKLTHRHADRQVIWWTYFHFWIVG
jgi:hypothetical protein